MKPYERLEVVLEIKGNQSNETDDYLFCLCDRKIMEKNKKILQPFLTLFSISYERRKK